MFQITIAGAGLSGLSAALTCAEHGIECNLISVQPSERAQSVLAEGGMNAALDTMGENDAPAFHFQDTMKGGVFLADPNAVKGLTDAAPGIIRRLQSIGVPFQLKDGDLLLRPFGGQKKRRTAYAMSSTGKIVMNALIDEARKYEAAGLIHRYDHAEIIEALTADYHLSEDYPAAKGRDIEDNFPAPEDPFISEGRRDTFAWTSSLKEKNVKAVSLKKMSGIKVRDTHTGKISEFPAPVIVCTGGIAGFFTGLTTGTTANTGDFTASLFEKGVQLGNLEMIQYHPTTVAISGKRLLISEAARGEGGRLFIKRKTGSSGWENWYFMEEKYPELKNLMPRDVISREMYRVMHSEDCGGQVFLDMTHLKKETWDGKLADLRKEVMSYLKLDPAKEPVPVSPGIHFFMGGILVDARHRASMPFLWAAGECACQYHGANRLGGNSMLAAVYGGHIAAEDALTFLNRGKMNLWTGNENEPCVNGDDPNVNVGELRVKGYDTRVNIGELRVNGGKPRVNDGDPRVNSDEQPGNADEQSNEQTDTSGRQKKGIDCTQRVRPSFGKKLTNILYEGLGIYRDEAMMNTACNRLSALEKEAATNTERNRILLGKAMLYSALERKESRGAHSRTDYPERRDEEYQKTTVAEYHNGNIRISFRDIPLQS